MMDKTLCQAPGWRMVDRFHGFRYSILLQNESNGDEIMKKIREKADEYSCFGWAQQPIDRSIVIVGEVRCNKHRGKQMGSWMRRLGTNVTLMEYPDTKIKLHFSYFKLVDKRRITCFRDQPHQCPEFA